MSGLPISPSIINNLNVNKEDNSKEKNNKNKSNALPLPLQFREEPTDFRKAKYGADLETNLVGDIWRLGNAAYRSTSPDVDFSDARKDIEEERLKEIYELYPEFSSGKYDNDLATWGGRTATLMLDPVYFLMPWGLALKGASLTTKAAKLAAMGGAVGTGDAAVREYSRTGEVTPSSLLLGGSIGAAAGPLGFGVQKLGGKVLNAAFPNLFKTKQQAEAVENLLKKNYEKKYDLNATQLQRVEEVSTLSSINKLFNNLNRAENTASKFYTPMHQIINKLQKIQNKKKYKNIKNISFKVRGQNVSLLDSSESSVQKAIKEVRDIYAKQGAKFNDLIVQRRHKHFIKVLEELEKRQGATAKVVRTLTAIAARPAVGAGGGAVYGTLFGEGDSIDWYIGTGAALGLTNKVLMSGRAKGISIPRQKEIAGQIKTSYTQNLLRNISILTSTSQWSKMSARGPILDSFAATIFARPTDTVQRNFFGSISKNQSRVIGSGSSVEELAQQNFAYFVGGISETIGIKNSAILDSAKGKLFRNRYLKTPLRLTVEEQNILKVEQDALTLVRGGKIDNASFEAQKMAGNIKDYLSNFRKYFRDVGFEEKELIENYFPRKFNFELINNNKREFLKKVEQAFDNLKANKKSNLSAREKTTPSKTLAREYYNRITQPDNGDILSLGLDKKIIRGKTQLPLSKHITEQRKLQGKYEEVEDVLKDFLVNDVRSVLTDITRNTVKSVEFARAFGREGEAINGYFSRIYKQYQDNGFSNEGLTNGFFNKQHKADVESIKNAVNSYFGRYGTQVDDWQKGTAAILSTLANFSMMDKVTIANLGDLIQPFQNSRHWFSWFKGIGFNRGNKASQDLNQYLSGTAKSNLKDAFTTSPGESSGLILNNKTSGNIMNIIGKSNEYFFKAIGLEGITNIARRYAYNVGAIDTHKTAQNFVKRLGQINTNNVNVTKINLNNIRDKKLLADILHLQKTGALQIDVNGNIVNLNSIINFGKTKNVATALKDTNSANIIQRVGIKAADRDAIIPTVGNRLLFTQTRNPWLRLLGQFSSWAMAKSAQTNAMIARVEEGNLKQLLGSLFALNVYGGIKEIREWAKYGEWNVSDDFSDDKQRWLADATQLSGNLGWLPSTIVNNFFGYNKNRPTDIAPAFQIAQDWVKFAQAAVDVPMSYGSKRSFDELFYQFYNVFPAPAIREIANRLGVPFTVYKKDTNIPLKFKIKKDRKDTAEKGLKGQLIKLMNFATGGLAEQEEEVTPEKVPVIKTDYQVDLNTEIPYQEDVSDKEQLKELVNEKPQIVRKEKPVPPLSFLFKNNNPGMVKVSSNWKGETFTGSSGEIYKKYPSKDEGLVDIINTIKQYKVNDLNTIMGIYAKDDASGKRAANYENILRKQFGVPNKIDFNNPSHVEALLKGITHVENSTVGQKYNYPIGSYNQYYLQEDYDKTLKRLGFNLGGLAKTIQRGLTQVTNTAKSYEKVNKIFDDFKVKSVHDFGSGLGVGTKKFTNKKVTSHEPFADLKKIEKVKGRKPDYIDVKDMIMGEGVKSKDGVINHMVLNVIENKTERDIVVKQIANLLNDKGVGVITTRTAQDVASASTKKPYLDGFLIKKGKEFTFQKGFSQSELKNYISEVLGDLFDVIDVPKKYSLGGSGVIITRKDKVNFRYGGYAAMRRAMTSNRAYSGSSGSTNRERYISSSNQSKSKTIKSDSGSTNRERYISSQSGGSGKTNSNNNTNTNQSSTTTTTTTNAGSGNSGGGNSTKEKTKDKVKSLLKKTRNKIERFTTENADILPGGETYEKNINLAYEGAKFGKSFNIGDNAGGSIYGKTGGILEGDRTVTFGVLGDRKTYPTEVPNINVSNVLDDSAVGIAAGVGGNYGLLTGSLDSKEGATIGYDVSGKTSKFKPSILGQSMTVGVTPYASATYKPLNKGDNFDGQIGATVTTPIGSADVFVTEEGNFNIGKSFNFKRGGLLDKKRG